ncbi:PAS domain S-box protein, partial [Candidatus Poribacteria bacterium]|nr:PAS domain S-box protein [Candidatus Poribacteria bacterium]
GFSASEVVGVKPPFPWWTDEIQEKIGVDFNKAFSEGVSGLQELFQKKNGEKFYVELTSSHITYDDEETKYFLTVWLDITERKKAEEGLKESREKLQLFIETTGEGMGVYDRDGYLLMTNNSAAQMLKGKPEDFIGKHISEFIREDTDIYLERIKEVFETGEYIEFNDKVNLSNGSQWFKSTYRPVKDESDVIYAVQITSVDITEIKNQEEELAQTKRILEDAQRIAHLGNWVWDFQTDYVWWSDELYRMYGRAKSSGPPLGDEWQSHIHPDDRGILQNAIEESKKTGRYKAEYRLIKYDDGSERIISAIGEVKFDELGEPLRQIGVALDVTEKRMMEEEMIKIQKLESIGVLASGIAHDFNNIMTAVMGNISLAKSFLQLGNPTSKVIERLDAADRATLQASELTKQLLTFTRGGAPVKELGSISVLLKDSADFILRGSGIKCNFSIPDNLYPLEFDEGQINQVINNILINARQAMPSGGTVYIDAKNVFINNETEQFLPSGTYIKINIQDEGIGIPKEHLQKIFDPFFSTKQTGSGLGLATAFSIIKKHDGNIQVESKLGEGTMFHIYLPASPEKTTVEKNKENTEVTSGSGKILIMDDEEIIGEMVSEMLSALGYEGTITTNGKDTIELYKKSIEEGETYDLVILDLTIPGGMGGVEVISKLKEINPDIKAIVSSGYSDSAAMSNFQSYGFIGVIAKPYTMQKMSKLLNETLKEGE